MNEINEDCDQLYNLLKLKYQFKSPSVDEIKKL